MKQVEIVIIGRNEGQRLRQCLLSVIEKVSHIVYKEYQIVDHRFFN